MCSAVALRRFPSIPFGTVPTFIQLTMAMSCPTKDHHWMLPLSKSLSSRQLMVWCSWLCAHKECLKLLNTSDHLICKPIVVVALCDQGSTWTTSPGVFEGGCQTLTHASLGFPFHFSLFVASSRSLREWWHVWPDCPYGWWSYLAWQWSPVLTRLRWLRHQCTLWDLVGCYCRCFFKWGACSRTPWVWKSIDSRELKNSPIRTTKNLSSQDNWETRLRMTEKQSSEDS